MNNNNDFYFDPNKTIEELYEEYKLSDISDKSIENFVAGLPDSLLFSNTPDIPEKEFPIFSTDEDIIAFLDGLPQSAFNVLGDHSIPEFSVEYVNRIDTSYIFSINGKNISLHSNVRCSIKELSCGELRSAILKDAQSMFVFINPSKVFRLGATNGLKILMSAFPNETYLFYLIRSIETHMLPYPKTFDHFSRQFWGSNISFKTNVPISSEVVQIYHLHKIVGENILKYKNTALQYIRSICDEFKTINKDIKVEYGGPSENNLSYVFFINDKEISIAYKNAAFNKITTEDIYELCKNLLSVVNNNGPLKDYIDKYGHSVIFSILQIIAFEETISFFTNKGKEFISSHQLLHPHLLLKSYGFTSSKTNQTFFDIILCNLEQLIEENKNNYIANNVFEYSKDDYWNIFYLKAETLAFFNFDFAKISNIQLRHEFLRFMREYVKYHNHSASATTFGRISLILEKLPKNINSILDVSRADVINIYSRSDKYRTHTVYKCLTITGTFFNFINATNGTPISSNPFYSIDHFDDTENIVPPDIKDIQKMLQNCSTVDNHIKLPFMLISATGARVSEITELTLDDIETGTDGEDIIIKNLRKTENVENHIPFVKNKIPKELSILLAHFIKETQPIREQFGKPYVFIYRTRKKRKNSPTPYEVLKPHTLNSEVRKWAIKVLGENKAKTVTPRSIRALVGTELFKYGYTASQISDILGNTPAVAEKHYINMSPSDQAVVRQKFFEDNFTHVFDNNDKVIIPTINTTILGACKSTQKCTRGNDCSSCEYRICCSEKFN